MYVILMSFLVAVILNVYNDLQYATEIETYRQKSELNKQCLIYNEAWGDGIVMSQLILSANSEDTHDHLLLTSLASQV